MVIPYHTTKFKSTNGVQNVVLGQTAKYNDRQYFWLYGTNLVTSLLSLPLYSKDNFLPSCRCPRPAWPVCDLEHYRAGYAALVDHKTQPASVGDRSHWLLRFSIPKRGRCCECSGQTRQLAADSERHSLPWCQKFVVYNSVLCVRVHVGGGGGGGETGVWI